MINTCIHCNSIIEKTKKFCNSSCSASFNNSNRKHTKETKEKISKSLKGKPSYFKNKFRIERIQSNCFVCNQSITIKSSAIHKNNTCKSNDCVRQLKVIAGKKSAQKRILRSKDEISLYEMCVSHFSNVTNNQIIEDTGWDADIILNDLKVAIFWNGPWHYKQMPHKNHSLLQVSNRDKIKTELFTKLGWKVIIFEDRHYSPDTAFKHLVEMLGTAPSSDRYERPASL